MPDRYSVTADYAINFELNKFSIGQWVRESLPSKGSTLDDATRRGINGERLYEGKFVGVPLTLDEWKDKDVYTRAAAELWQFMLAAPVEITFPMLARLSDCILRFNPKILAALRASYAYVFLDEFQDTSAVHYGLTSTSFLGSSSVITAVGDNKQRVNKWAGALDGIFERFETEFDAERNHLLLNYRSAPELVRIQAFVAAAIDSEAPPAMPAVQLADGEEDGECLSYEFSSHRTEAKILADKIDAWMKADALSPRDLCVLSQAIACSLRGRLTPRRVPSSVGFFQRGSTKGSITEKKSKRKRTRVAASP